MMEADWLYHQLAGTEVGLWSGSINLKFNFLFSWITGQFARIT
jgi:hypothetical protein